MSIRLKPTMYRRIVSTLVAAALACLATTAWSQPGNIYSDEHVAAPVPHRFIHGRLGDANFQIALPDDWNGKLLIGARGFSGNEFSAGQFKTIGLTMGYAYALSDQGWNRFTIIDRPQDSYLESRRRIVQLTNYTKSTVSRHYGVGATRTFMVGGSNGGHNAKMMVEDYPALYDGAIAGYGITSHMEWMAGMTRFLRNFDIIAARIDDIVAARANDPDWDPASTPLNPPLDAEQVEALFRIYVMPARLASGLEFNNGRPPGSEYRWAENYDSLLGYVTTSLSKFDRKYDPDGDGELSTEEMKAWDPNLRPKQIHNDIRRLDNSGDLQRPVIIMHGIDDIVVSVGETEAYKRQVEERLGFDASRLVLAVYYIPGMGHGGAEYNALIGASLDVLEEWVDYLESDGAQGALPPDQLGPYPRD